MFTNTFTLIKLCDPMPPARLICCSKMTNVAATAYPKSSQHGEQVIVFIWGFTLLNAPPYPDPAVVPRHSCVPLFLYTWQQNKFTALLLVVLVIVVIALAIIVAVVALVVGELHTFQMYIIIHTLFRSLARHKSEWDFWGFYLGEKTHKSTPKVKS